MSDTAKKAQRFAPAVHKDGGLCMKPSRLGGWVSCDEHEAMLTAERDALKALQGEVDVLRERLQDLELQNLADQAEMEARA